MCMKGSLLNISPLMSEIQGGYSMKAFSEGIKIGLIFFISKIGILKQRVKKIFRAR